MTNSKMVIAGGSLKQGQLQGTTVLLTGGGGGIGFEAARALLWLGAGVAIAEIDRKRGEAAEKALASEFGAGKAVFFQADISDEASVKKLCGDVERKFGRVDVLFNNATIAPIGAAHKVGVKNWDHSYAVNLRGPVLLLERLLPSMLERKSGTVVFVPSSGAAPYMGAYEVFKTAQVELCNTLAGELEGTGVVAFSIGPGIVKTETADRSIHEIAPLYGKSVEEFYAMNAAVLISPEEAGAGFAAAVVMAGRYDGAETSSLQALADAGISLAEKKEAAPMALSEEAAHALQEAFAPVLKTYREQHAGWMGRNVFERQWIIRDFKKETGSAPDIALEELNRCEQSIAKGVPPARSYEELILDKLAGYWAHQKSMMVSYEKDKRKAEENAATIDGWIREIGDFKKLFSKLSE